MRRSCPLGQFEFMFAHGPFGGSNLLMNSVELFGTLFFLKIANNLFRNVDGLELSKWRIWKAWRCVLNSHRLQLKNTSEVCFGCVPRNDSSVHKKEVVATKQLTNSVGRNGRHRNWEVDWRRWLFSSFWHTAAPWSTSSSEWQRFFSKIKMISKNCSTSRWCGLHGGGAETRQSHQQQHDTHQPTRAPNQTR